MTIRFVFPISGTNRTRFLHHHLHCGSTEMHLVLISFLPRHGSRRSGRAVGSCLCVSSPVCTPLCPRMERPGGLLINQETGSAGFRGSVLYSCSPAAHHVICGLLSYSLVNKLSRMCIKAPKTPPVLSSTGQTILLIQLLCCPDRFVYTKMSLHVNIRPPLGLLGQPKLQFLM